MATQLAGVQVADVCAWPWERGRLRGAQRALPHRHRPHAARRACSKRSSCTSTGTLVHCPPHMLAAGWGWQPLTACFAMCCQMMVHGLRVLRVRDGVVPAEQP